MRTQTSSTDAFTPGREQDAPTQAWAAAAVTKPLRNALRALLQKMLRGVAAGSIHVQLPDGQHIEARGVASGPHASVVVHHWRTLLRLALNGDIGLAESYRDGDWSTNDLTALLEFGIRNEDGCGGMLQASVLTNWLFRLFHLAHSNTRRGSRHNISFHYDLGNDFYGHWLDPDMIYSSALYSDDSNSLEEAQAAKLDRIVELLQVDGLSGDQSILEIGCGWGALAIELSRRCAARLTGLTLSSEQLAHAQRRVANIDIDIDAEGHTARAIDTDSVRDSRVGESGSNTRDKQIDLRLQDYRDVDGKYDRVVSIEMLEAVGEKYWPAYFKTVNDRLRPGGVAVIQVITIADEHFDHYRRNADFIQRFIFPGGMLPTVSAMQREAAAAGLSMITDESFGSSYGKTLVEWRKRFLRAWPSIQALGFDDEFKRLWEYYLCYCEAGFRTGRVDVGLYTLKHAA